MITREESARGAESDAAEPWEPEEDLPLPARTSALRRDAVVGGFVLLGLAAVLIALFTLTDAADFRGRYFISTVVEDAGGLRDGDPVQMRGVDIGRVSDFEMTEQGVRIRLELEDDYEVPADSRVALRSKGLLGGRIVDIVPGDSERTVEPGAVLPGRTVTGMFGAAADVGEQAQATLTRVQELLSERTVSALGESAVQLRSLITDLAALAAEQRQELDALTASLRRSAAGVEGAVAGPELERIVARLDTISRGLARTTESLGRASASLETVLARIERGEGTLGRLSTDDALYENLNAAALELDRLLEDVQQNPGRYIDVGVF